MAKKESTFNQSEYIQRYMKENNVRVQVILNKNYDSDIITHLNTMANKSGYIKRLIREDLEVIERRKKSNMSEAKVLTAEIMEMIRMGGYFVSKADLLNYGLTEKEIIEYFPVPDVYEDPSNPELTRIELWDADIAESCLKEYNSEKTK